MARWMMPTLKDKHEAQKALVPQLDTPSHVTCGCGRNTLTDMMVDLTVLDDSKNLPHFVCDGCWSTLLREKVVTLDEIGKAHKAPKEILDKFDTIHKKWYSGSPPRNPQSHRILRDKTKKRPK